MISETLNKLSRKVLKDFLLLFDGNEMRVFNSVHSPKKLDSTIEEVLNNIDNDKIDNAITLCENILRRSNQPYLINFTEESFLELKFNPNFGDDKECECKHSYYRHFDPYENMENVGCKYCG
jgi:hypothetical protein